MTQLKDCIKKVTLSKKAELWLAERIVKNVSKNVEIKQLKK